MMFYKMCTLHINIADCHKETENFIYLLGIEKYILQGCEEAFQNRVEEKKLAS